MKLDVNEIEMEEMDEIERTFALGNICAHPKFSITWHTIYRWAIIALRCGDNDIAYMEECMFTVSIITSLKDPLNTNECYKKVADQEDDCPSSLQHFLEQNKQRLKTSLPRFGRAANHTFKSAMYLYRFNQEAVRKMMPAWFEKQAAMISIMSLPAVAKKALIIKATSRCAHYFCKIPNGDKAWDRVFSKDASRWHAWELQLKRKINEVDPNTIMCDDANKQILNIDTKGEEGSGFVCSEKHLSEKEEHKKNICVVCIDNEATLMGHQCGHLAWCRTCRRKAVHAKLTNTGTKKRMSNKQLDRTRISCPICRAETCVVQFSKKAMDTDVFVPLQE